MALRYPSRKEDRDICGIITAIDFRGKPVNKIVNKRFQAQRHRGLQGFGVFDLEYKNLVRSTTEHGIKKWLKKYKSSKLMFHHRFPTSTDNVKNACHPFSTKDFFKTNYVLIHNGHISNSHELKKAHETLGIKYHSVQPDGTFNDSEALLWDFALHMEGKQDKVEARGNIALICLALGKGNQHPRLHYVRNNNPIVVHRTNKRIVLASEGHGELIPDDTLHTLDLVNLKSTTRPLEFEAYAAYNTTGVSYPNYRGAYAYNDFDNDDLEQTEVYAFDIKHMLIHRKRMESLIAFDIKRVATEALENNFGIMYDASIELCDNFDLMAEFASGDKKSQEMRLDWYHRSWEDLEYTMNVYLGAVDAIDNHPLNTSQHVALDDDDITNFEVDPADIIELMASDGLLDKTPPQLPLPDGRKEVATYAE